MYHSINLRGNTKTMIPTTTSSKESCPDSCPLKVSGCYAKYSFLGGFWEKLSNGEIKNSGNFSWLLHQIKGLQKGQLWRHNQAGDLPHIDGRINSHKMASLIKANKGRRGFTYTHHLPELSYNALAIYQANRKGFTVNLSANNLDQADEYKKLNIGPVVTLLPVDAEKVAYTPAGNKIVACPAENNDKINCGNCGLCYLVDRDYIIGFRAHGVGKKKVETIARQSNLIPLAEVA